MDRETRYWTALLLVATIAGPVYDAIKEPSPPASEHSPALTLQLLKLPAFDPVASLSLLGKRIGMRFSIDEGGTFNNITSQNFILQNTGTTPIQPKDFAEPFTVTVSPPWKIISVESSQDTISVDWKRRKDTMFVGAPLLINPGDSLEQTVYATNTAYQKGQSPETQSKFELKVTARIVNMKGFSTPGFSALFNGKNPVIRLPRGLIVYADSWGVLFLVGCASLFFYGYIILLRQANIVPPPSGSLRGVVLVLAAAISYAVAEVFTTYIFGTDPIWTLFAAHGATWEAQSANWMTLGINLIALLSLLWRANVVTRARSP
jgi:hypothetical protein